MNEYVTTQNLGFLCKACSLVERMTESKAISDILRTSGFFFAPTYVYFLKQTPDTYLTERQLKDKQFILNYCKQFELRKS
ncbi:MAG: hypothetical protein QXP53_00025 [Candidatus Pacearchaeota archaeon]